jgi:hypothetical protein
VGNKERQKGRRGDENENEIEVEGGEGIGENTDNRVDDNEDKMRTTSTGRTASRTNRTNRRRQWKTSVFQ